MKHYLLDGELIFSFNANCTDSENLQRFREYYNNNMGKIDKFINLSNLLKDKATILDVIKKGNNIKVSDNCYAKTAIVENLIKAYKELYTFNEDQFMEYYIENMISDVKDDCIKSDYIFKSKMQEGHGEDLDWWYEYHYMNFDIACNKNFEIDKTKRYSFQEIRELVTSGTIVITGVKNDEVTDYKAYEKFIVGSSGSLYDLLPYFPSSGDMILESIYPCIKYLFVKSLLTSAKVEKDKDMFTYNLKREFANIRKDLNEDKEYYLKEAGRSQLLLDGIDKVLKIKTSETDKNNEKEE